MVPALNNHVLTLSHLSPHRSSNLLSGFLNLYVYNTTFLKKRKIQKDVFLNDFMEKYLLKVHKKER